MLAFLCAPKHMTDPFSSVTGKQYFALHLRGRSNELTTLPCLSCRLVPFLPFNFFPASSLHPFLLSVTSGVSALALCWKITSFQCHSGWQQWRPQQGCRLFHHRSVSPDCLVTEPWLLHRHCSMVENTWAFYTMSVLPAAPNDRGAVLTATEQPKFPRCTYADAGVKNA